MRLPEDDAKFWDFSDVSEEQPLTGREKVESDELEATLAEIVNDCDISERDRQRRDEAADRNRQQAENDRWFEMRKAARAAESRKVLEERDRILGLMDDDATDEDESDAEDYELAFSLENELLGEPWSPALEARLLSYGFGQELRNTPIGDKAVSAIEPAEAGFGDKTVPNGDKTVLSIDSSVPTSAGKKTRPERFTHYMCEERDRLFVRRLRERSAVLGHPYRKVRDPETGAPLSLLLRSPRFNADLNPLGADNLVPAKRRGGWEAPPLWRDLTPRTKIVYGIEAMRHAREENLTEAVFLTIKLGDVIKERLEGRDARQALDFCVRRVNKELKRRLGEVPLIITGETSGELGFHLHAVAELNRRQKLEVADCILDAVGRWRHNVERQVVKQNVFSQGVATYITKETHLIRQATGGVGYHYSRSLRARAENIFNLDRRFIQETGGFYERV